jgi:hypothetical protein
MISILGLDLNGVETGGIIATILGVLGFIYAGLKKFTSFILKYKNKFYAAISLLTQSVELIEVFDKAIEDKSISKEEIEALRKEINDVKEAYKNLKK